VVIEILSGFLFWRILDIIACDDRVTNIGRLGKIHVGEGPKYAHANIRFMLCLQPIFQLRIRVCNEDYLHIVLDSQHQLISK